MHNLLQQQKLITPSQRCCMFEDTSLGLGMTYLHILTMKVTRLYAQVYKVTSLDFNTITLHCAARQLLLTLGSVKQKKLKYKLMEIVHQSF